MSKRSENLQLAKEIERMIDQLAGVVAVVEKQPERADTTTLRIMREKLEKVFE